MNGAKVLALILIAAFVVPTTVLAGVYSMKMSNERVVEGHTSYVVMTKQVNKCPKLHPLETNVSPCPPKKENATALAVLTSENQCITKDTRATSGVLWFNDQFLVDEDDNGQFTDCTVRYPCGGTVYAVSPVTAADPGMSWGTYQESYHIIDPNNNVWVIDHYLLNGVTRIWNVNIQGTNTFADGTSDTDNLYTPVCGPFTDTASAAATANTGTYGNTLTYPTITYNALLFMRFNHLVRTGAVEYGYDPVLGANGMEETTDGNSHPWNNGPTAANASETHTHETAQVNVYYTYEGRTSPTTRKYYLYDTVGSTAPFDQH